MPTTRTEPNDAADPSFPRITYSSLTAFRPNATNHLAGNGLIRRGAGTLLTGGTGLGKTVLAEQIAVCIAGGIPILGRINVPSACRVLYVQAESDEETLARDLVSIATSAPGYVCPFLLEVNLLMHHVFGLSGAEFAVWLRNRVRLDRPDLVVVDPFQGFIGGSDINSSQTFLAWINPVEDILKTYGVALLLVAHATKPRDRSDWTDRESVYLAAGSSALSNWARCSVELTQERGDEGRFRLRFGKNPERTGLHSDQGKVLKELFIQHAPDQTRPFWQLSPDQTPKSASGKYDDQVRQLLATDGKLSDVQIAQQLGCDRSTVYRTRQRL